MTIETQNSPSESLVKPATKKQPAYQLVRLATLVFFRSLFIWKFNVRDQHNIPETGGAILAPEHGSYIDPPAITWALTKKILNGRKVYFVAKAEIERIPVLGAVLRACGVIYLDLEHTERKAIRELVDLLKEGHLVVMFPEGTRSKNGKLGTLKRGVALIAKEAQVPLIPVALPGAFEAWPPHHLFPRPGCIIVVFGRSISLEGKTRQVAERLHAAIDTISEL